MATRSDVIDYRILGDDLQFVEVELDPGETVIGEAGAMMFLDADVRFETKMGDGADPEQGLWGRLKDAGKRALTQESVFLTHFTNGGRQKRVVAFSAEFPGTILPVDLAAVGGTIWPRRTPSSAPPGGRRSTSPSAAASAPGSSGARASSFSG